MQVSKLKTRLETLGLPVAYQAFKTAVEPPFIAFVQSRGDSFSADNIVFAKNTSYRIELYTEEKDEDLEARLELLLTENQFYFEKDEAYIPEEELIEILYEIGGF